MALGCQTGRVMGGVLAGYSEGIRGYSDGFRGIRLIWIAS